jgi:hypothetical protein
VNDFDLFMSVAAALAAVPLTTAKLPTTEFGSLPMALKKPLLVGTKFSFVRRVQPASPPLCGRDFAVLDSHIA